jgi:hypothetical protein
MCGMSWWYSLFIDFIRIVELPLSCSHVRRVRKRGYNYSIFPESILFMICYTTCIINDFKEKKYEDLVSGWKLHCTNEYI